LISKDSGSFTNEVVPGEKAPPHVSCQGKPSQLHTTLRKKAMDLLARREHAVAELQQKVQAYAKKQDLDEREVTVVIEELIGDGLVSDERFTEAFVRYRRNNGYGPRRIQTELRERGVSEKISAAYLDFADPQWLEQVAQVRRKRFGEDMPKDYKERARQARFLQYRGFTTDQVRWVLAGDDLV
jgi:regulatory protein